MLARARARAAPGCYRRIVNARMPMALRRSRSALAALAALALFIGTAVLAPWIAPHDPFDLATLKLGEALTPPAWCMTGSFRFLMGTDDQGRDVLSAMLFGARASLVVASGAVMLAAFIGVSAGVLAGYHGGWCDALIMRLADLQLVMPAFLVAILLDGVARTSLPAALRDDMMIYVLIAAIGLADWPRYARVVRGATLVERGKLYVEAANAIGARPVRIICRHLLPNVAGPAAALAMMGFALAISTEASLSFLGIGLPPTQPTLGGMIRLGNNFLYSGEWWIALFPSLVLCVVVVSINILGNWLLENVGSGLA